MHTTSVRAAALFLSSLSLAAGCDVGAEPADAAVDTAQVLVPEAGPETIDPRDARAMSIVVGVDERSFVVLDAAPSPEWAVGEAVSLIESPGWLVAERAVDLALLPDDVRARASEPWTLIAGDGSRCSATLDAPRLLRRAEGFAWEDGSMPEGSPLWDEALEILVAEAHSFDGDCSNALFAHTIDHAPQRVFRPMSEPIAASREAAARASFEGLASYRAITAEYDAYVASAHEIEPATDWRSYDGADSLRVVVLRSADGQERVLVTATAGYGCGGFFGSLYALYEPTDAGLVLREEGTAADAPTMIVELDGDVIAHVGGQRLRYRGPALTGLPEPIEATEWIDVTTPFFGCPC